MLKYLKFYQLKNDAFVCINMEQIRVIYVGINEEMSRLDELDTYNVQIQFTGVGNDQCQEFHVSKLVRDSIVRILEFETEETIKLMPDGTYQKT